jgi:hypothetical protein
MRRMFLVAAALAAPLALASPLTSGVAAPASRTIVPAPLVGTWGKTVTLATWHKSGVYGIAGGHWTMTIKKDALTKLTLFAPPAPAFPAFSNMRVSTSGTSLVFGPTSNGDCPGKGSYTWKVSGSTLVVKVIKDGCSTRQVLMTAGTWKRG